MSTMPPPEYDFLSPDELFADKPPDVEPEDTPIPLSFEVDPLSEAPRPAAPEFSSDGGWSWHDGALVAVERTGASGEPSYEIGVVDLYTNAHTGDLGGSYLPIDSFADLDQAAACYQQLQDEIEAQRLLPFQLVDFAGAKAAQRALENGTSVPDWRACTPAEFSAYDDVRSLSTFDSPEVQAPSFKALREIGIVAEGFDPDADPPPFYDAETGTAYWIGVFQPDRDDREHCITSVLSLGRDPDTGEVQAQLAPCVPGDWDKAYDAAEYLLDVVEKGGIDRCLEAAEGMALAAEQRGLWEHEHGIPLEPNAAQELAEYTRDQWEIDL